ncbi:MULTISPECIES: hypothetical protein [Paenibacillus]|uniref:Uncharacterized protein n=1 Tax=Paenibacillus radicis (ex Xue et al. 2023) TaxID=2972489 RepID=A0ABT1YPV8_9BACL|nr:hypothetical protein [Paenibacillus radicis (ex Xue et al. 2023)]MCR8635213.1 hypothetical protein [Paenibacillus radicis (ex Xue et al. 2023)]
MATIILLLCLVIIGSFFSAALVLFFQRKKRQGSLQLCLGFITIILFYYAIYNDWISIPEHLADYGR